MFHTIEFEVQLVADLEISRKQPLEKIVIQPKTRLRAQLKPFVAQRQGCLIEVADLFFEDGTVTRGVPYACFHFVD